MGKRVTGDDGRMQVLGKSGNKEGSIYQRKDGRWVGSVTLPDGRRKDVYGKTRDAVRAAMQTTQGDVQRGVVIPTGRETVEQFLERWLTDVAKQRVRASTFDRYRRDVCHHIIPTLGKKRLSELTPRLVQQFLNDLTTSATPKGRGKRQAKPQAPLGPRGVAHTRAVLRNALQRAVREGLVAQNVAKLVDVPRNEPKPVAAITPDDARAILDAFSGHDYEGLVTLALATGMRCGELLGLKWGDVDLGAGTVRIERQLQRLDGEYQLVALKTTKSRRTLALPAVASEALRRQKTRQAEAKLAAGPAWHDAGLVFTTALGGPIHGSTVTHRFQKRLHDAGLPPRRFHDLRHGAASLLLAGGANIRSVMEQLGHSQISLTMNTYAHIAPEILRQNAATLDAALRGRGTA
jgi:integrase